MGPSPHVAAHPENPSSPFRTRRTSAFSLQSLLRLRAWEARGLGCRMLFRVRADFCSLPAGHTRLVRPLLAAAPRTHSSALPASSGLCHHVKRWCRLRDLSLSPHQLTGSAALPPALTGRSHQTQVGHVHRHSAASLPPRAFHQAPLTAHS